MDEGLVWLIGVWYVCLLHSVHCCSIMFAGGNIGYGRIKRCGILHPALCDILYKRQGGFNLPDKRLGNTLILTYLLISSCQSAETSEIVKPCC